ncbi:copper chaperone PCu(A)C [Bradyrhizobium sp. DASA03007]|uniref:copper chaperone PCu(A)C n=1 Tax=unclassified Bradyrhizobium TaxID=2631580 RepID=UPI003F724A95
MKRPFKLILSIALALIAGAQVNAQTSSASSVVVERPWARATPGGAKTGAAYLILINNGEAGDQLLGATTPVADKVQFHSTTEENGMSRMREMPVVDLVPHAKTTFDPGGMHIMLVDLKQPLKEGQTFSLSLTFAKAGKVDVTVPVAKVGAMRPSDMAPMMHHHDDTMKE